MSKQQNHSTLIPQAEQALEAALARLYSLLFPNAENQWSNIKMSRSESLNELARQMVLLGMDPRNYLICSKEEEKMRFGPENSPMADIASRQLSQDAKRIAVDPVGPPTLFQQLDQLFTRLGMLSEQVYHLHDRLVGASPEPAEAKRDFGPNGSISHYELAISDALMEIAKIDDRLTQINRRL